MGEIVGKKQAFLLRRRILAGLVLAVVVGAVWFLLKSYFWPKEIRHIVLISIDTCRADYLGCYGYPGKITPNIDAIARESILFENVVTPVPLTIPAHSTMLTGTSPLYHGVHGNVGYRLGDSNVTLAEILRTHGYQTAAVIGEFVLSARFGFAQGFDTYNDRFLGKREPTFIRERRAQETSDLAKSWLAEHTRNKFFLFLHYFDPHHEYIPPEPFASTFADNPYAGEIAYTDRCIGEVINRLKDLGLYDSTLIIITGDHGESLGEHDEHTHGYFVYNTTLKVPLIFKLPASTTPKRIKDIVGLADIVPTILGYLGIPSPPQVQGKDLSAYFEKKTKTRQQRYFYFESLFPTTLGCSALRGIVSDNWKYIHTTRPELYNLATDPGEKDNLIDKEPKHAGLMKNQLKTILADRSQPSKNDAELLADQQTLDRLKALGYLGGGINERRELDQNGDDPKDFVALYNQVVEMLVFRDKNQPEEVKTACRQILQQRPGLGIVHSVLGSILEKQGDNDQALKHFRQALESKYNSKSDNVIHHVKLANVLLKQGKQDEAVSHYSEALRLNPHCAEAHSNLATVLTICGNIDNAIGHFSEALKINPNYSTAHHRLANALAMQGKFEDAIEHFLEVITLKPDIAIVHYQLANCLVKTGETAQAIREYGEAMHLSPDRPEPANNLAWILATHKNPQFRDPAKAVKLAEFACERTSYSNPVFLNTLAAAYAATGNNPKAIQTAEKALNLARSKGQQQLVEAIKKRLELYKSGQR